MRLPPQTGTCATTGYGRLGRLVPRPPTLAYARSAGWEGPRRDFRPKPRPGEKRGPHIDRHPMGLCRCFLSQIVCGHTDDDIRHCGGPIGSKLRQKRRSHVFFHGFWPFLGEKGFVCCRVFGIASPGCPRPRLRLSVLHEDARALTYTRITSCSSSTDYL